MSNIPDDAMMDIERELERAAAEYVGRRQERDTAKVSLNQSKLRLSDRLRKYYEAVTGESPAESGK